MILFKLTLILLLSQMKTYHQNQCSDENNSCQHSLKQNPKMLLMFIRHGERLDQVQPISEKDKNTKYPKCDPGLTQNGKQQAFLAGKLANLYIQDKGYEKSQLKIISSPFIRTLQTAAYFQNSLDMDHSGEILINNNICVQLVRGKYDSVFQDGVMATEGEVGVISNWLDNKASKIIDDEGALNLYKTDGSFKENSDHKKFRYIAGIKDIINRHFMQNELEKQVITLVSHSDGLNNFVKIFKPNADSLAKAGYCALISVEIEKISDDDYKLLDFQIIQR